ncbi:organic hydroperoxide reductase OsmC/OhrA [Nocardia transvalensis]|uniref:Organic hydroperoxide reductase OsmC/OhrA n=1 Tax=Nocardia transvalensis TaxID=37333 RepID=A0A7W9UMB4_9NOCA|nr:OsmC family protein [Nocardia transvalensis]MBB5918182.1 organic hydroperoxide reductase OsmC/OhrA [Nocardia transvalensis]
MHRYEVEVAWSGATTGYRSYSRNHDVRAEGRPPLPASADPVVGRGDATRWNPELLLVASLSECHMLWYLHLCTQAGIVVTDYRDAAEGTMNNDRFTQVTLRPRVTVTDPAHLDTARALHTEAHKHCFIANSVNFPVDHAPTVTT